MSKALIYTFMGICRCKYKNSQISFTTKMFDWQNRLKVDRDYSLGDQQQNDKIIKWLKF